MKLKVGSQAPDFTLPLVQGNPFKLTSVLKSGPVIINFIRGTWCEYCTAHLNRQRNWQIAIDGPAKKITILVISTEPIPEIRAWVNANHGSQFLMASDIGFQVSEMYGVKLKEDAYSRPAMFVIDRDRTIRLMQIDDLENKELEKNTETATFQID